MSLKQGSQANAHSIQTAFARAKAMQMGPNDRYRNENKDDQERTNRDNPSWKDPDEAQCASTPSILRIGTVRATT